VPDDSASAPRSERPTGWALVGRAPELARIAVLRSGGAPGVVLHGPAGVGKSRLAREAVAAAEADGALVEWVQATRSAATVPFGAFADLIPEDARSDEPLELMRRSVDLLRERAAGRPVVLGVDDAQLLDPTSAALVLHLAMTGLVTVIATVRSGEPCPDAIVSLWKDAGAERIELAELSEAEVGALVEAIAGGPVEEAARLWAYETSRGNALYVRELVGGALEGGALREGEGLWRMPRRPPVSATLAELVAARLVGVDDAVRDLLGLLAVGEPLRIAELDALAGDAALIAAEARGFVTVDALGPAAEVRLAHPLYGEVLAAELGVLRARELRRRLARTLEARPGFTAGDALRVARWLLDAGEEIPAALLVDAARAANRSGDPDLAATLAGRAADTGAGLDATLLLARAHVVRNRFAEAEAVLAPLEGTIRTQETAVAYLEQRAVAVLYWGLARPEDALALVARAQEWWPDQGWRRRLDPIRLHLASLSEGFDEAVAVTESILADPALEPEMRRQLEPLHTVNLYYGGRTRDAYALAERLRPSVPLDGHGESIALMNWCIIGLETGEDFAGLEAWMTQTLQDGIRGNDDEAAAMAALTLGGLRLFDGRLRDAARWLAEAQVHFERRDPFGALVAARATQVLVAQASGDADATAAALEAGRATAGWRDALPSLAPYVVRAEAWGLHAAGDVAGARTMLCDASAASRMPGYAAQLAFDAVRAGAPASALAPELTALAARCDSRMAAAYAGHARALAARDGEALLAAAGEWEAIGMRRFAVEAAAAAAAAFHAGGRQDSARRAAVRSRELFALGQGGVPPAIDGVDAAALGLTAREEQLVALARRGLTNAEIADRLVLSVRTVESHIYRAMQKLGVSDRRDL